MPLLISVGGVVVKCVPGKDVVDLEYILPTSFIASSGYHRSSIMASNLGWLMNLNEFLKSMYVM